MSSNSTVDRRILKAFYTQYVAVLLILLVFSVGMVSRGDKVKSSVLAPDNMSASHNTQLKPRQIAAMHYAKIFATEHSSELSQAGELEAVLAALKNHDLSATFLIPVDLKGEDLVESSSLALARSRSISDRLVASGITKEAFKVILTPAISRDSQITVVFEEWESRHAV